MDFSSIPIFNVMRAKMAYMSERQSVLAQNIANADTPGYQAKDVAEPDFKAMMGGSAQHLQSRLPMAVTDNKHMSGGGAKASSYSIINRDSTYEMNPDGNNVAIEEEMAKVASNQADYQKVLNMYRKSVDMFKTAIGKSS